MTTPTNRALLRTLIGCSALLAAAGAAAAPITFDFDGMAYRSSSSPGPNSAVQTYLQGIWAGAGMSGNVLVWGAGELSNSRYTGDGHAVGPEQCTRYYANGTCRQWTVTPLTLGNTEGGVQGFATVESPPPTEQNPDNYIVNSGRDRIIIQFPIPIYSLSFDFEIFPDGTCPNLQHCGSNNANLPDFSFLYGNTYATLVPGMSTVYGTLPGSPGTYAHSPSSGHAHTEPAPQYLGVSGPLNIPGGATIFEFVDWPRRIGIDNLVVSTTCQPCQQVPEPPTLPIAALALGLVLVSTRRLRRTH